MTDSHGYWRSLAEYNDPSSKPGSTPEFAEPAADPTAGERRRFLQIMGASTALASAATGCRWQEDKILPYSQRPEGVVPGEARYFRTAMELGGSAVGLQVKSVDGRPLKVDGNAEHPDSLGASSLWHQASILELYDPDRSTGYAVGAGAGLNDATETEFRVFAKKHFRELRGNKGKGLRVIAGASTSQAVAAGKARFLDRFPEARWVEYEPVSLDNARRGSELAFGAPVRTHLNVSAAKVIVALDADFLGAGPTSLPASRGWAAGRDPASGSMNRVYSFESSLSETGVAADHRLSVRSEHIKAIAVQIDAALDKALGAPAASIGSSQPAPAAGVLTDEAVKKTLAAAVSDLVAQKGASLLLAGDRQPPEVHALVHRINQRLGNVGKTLSYTALPAAGATSAEGIAQLAAEMLAGKVSTLLILDSNPLYTAPADAKFAEALSKVATKVSLGLYRDETARKCDWHVPLSHYLETWGDVRGSRGAQTIQQPLIAPLYKGKSVAEFLALVTRSTELKGQDILRTVLSSVARDPRMWRKAIHDGVVPGSEAAPVVPTLRPLAAFKLSSSELSGLSVEPKDLELVLAADPKVYDGRFANSGWLQELPDSVSKLTWDNALLIGPKTAEVLGIDDEMLVTVSVAGRSVTAPALLSPGQAAGSVKLYLGYGRTAAGRVGGNDSGRNQAPSVGVNAYLLRSQDLWSFGNGATVQATSERSTLATTQTKHTMDIIGKHGIDERLGELVRETTLPEYKAKPDFAKHVVHHPELLSLWKEPVKYEGHKWGMTIDLNRCVGCSGCVVACQAENNIPVVGKEQVDRGREMHWLRIDRYFQGNPENPKMVSQPIPCMHCEHAPCEEVCPVGATMHSSEGINEMTYNRCVGTRYCSNNCPYKVRKYNYLNFHMDMKEEENQVKGMVFNPDVTVRFRGVMEKCSYCIQRVQNGKFKADREGRPLKDGDVTTACQDACPTQAIVFGDMNDANSVIAKSKADPRDYALLEELNVRPRTTYGARVRNPHPELG